ncbi:hypothetical protein EON83_15465 [bacterium]|nr:MAG: hypothetical protein EON83_15465 [bacterium]
MANRAYLYFTDDVSALTSEQHYKRADGSERVYMDSRHQLPLAWLLFFRPEHIWVVLDTEHGWYDMYFVRDWSSAKDEFLRRVPLLLSWFPNELSQSDVETFLGWLDMLIANPNEKFLVIDPHQVIEGSSPETDSAPSIRSTLQSLEDATLSEQEKFERLDVWSNCKYSYNFLEQFDTVFGAYYGGYFEP